MLNELKNLRVFDSITFHEKDHSYKIDGQPAARYSVTGIVNTVKSPFEEDKWSKIKAKEYNCTPEEVKLVWKKNNQMSTHQGSIFHNYVDNFYQNKIIPYNQDLIKSILGETLHNMLRENLKVLIKQFNSFHNDTRDSVLPIKNELVIGDIHATRVCGMLDMLVYNTETNEFEIYDFKTNKEFSEVSRFNKKLLSPLDHLDDCEYNIYSLQLSLYKKFIEKYTNIKISSLKIAWFTINNTDGYKIIELKNLSDEVDVLLKATPVL